MSVIVAGLTVVFDDALTDLHTHAGVSSERASALPTSTSSHVATSTSTHCTLFAGSSGSHLQFIFLFLIVINALRLHGVGPEGLSVTDRQEAFTFQETVFLIHVSGGSTGLILQHRRGSADRIWPLDLLLMLNQISTESRRIVAIVTPNICFYEPYNRRE